jgi:hypothetical protein
LFTWVPTTPGVIPVSDTERLLNEALSLVWKIGKSDRRTVETVVGGIQPSVLMELGRRVPTHRLIEQRMHVLIVTQRTLSRATPTQQDLVITITPTFLSAAATAIHETAARATLVCTCRHDLRR